MSTHLTAQQISEALIGEDSPAHEAHLRTCSVCQKQVNDMHAALAGFRSSVRLWSKDQMNAAATLSYPHRSSQNVSHARRTAIPGKVLAAVSVFLVAVVGITIATHGPFSEPTVEVRAPVSDAVLLDQIKMDVSRSVPIRLEPLLVTRDDVLRDDVSPGYFR